MTDATLDVVRIRQGRKEDQVFIIDSWLESYRLSRWAKKVPGPIYYREHKARVLETLRSSTVLVACDKEQDDHLVGWCAYDTRALHYVYVKGQMRRFGIARELIQPCRGVVKLHTHETSHGAVARLRACLHSMFNPYLF
jgi:spore coat polysaccharide biosynthesis protein SpsF (cytidylyltransferase family)